MSTLRPLALAVALILAPIALPAPSYAAARPDLAVTAVTAPAEARAGGTVAVKVSTRNIGRGRSGPTTTTVYLSKDTRPGQDVATASVKVPRLARGRTHTATVRLAVPAGTAPRGYRVLACADARRKVREVREGNNCRVAKRAVTVIAPPDPDPDPDVPEFPLVPDPITVSPVVDESRAVSETVYPHQDTEITATGADGTTYTLLLPTGALFGVEQVTMTPLASVGDLPLSGGLVAGVELEPHGLLLMESATLTIDSPDLGPLAQQTAFYFHEGGEDFHLYPVLPPKAGDDANTVRMRVDHFSTPGVGLGTATDRQQATEHPPARSRGQLEAANAELTRAERASVEAGNQPDPAVTDQLVANLDNYHDNVVRQGMEAAETNASRSAEAIADGLAWSRQVQLLGDDDNPRHAEIMARVERILRNVMEDGWTRCSTDHDLRALPNLVRVARMAALFGYSWAEDAFGRYQRCSHFEVRFDSLTTIAGTSPAGGEEFWHVPRVQSGRWRATATAQVDWTAIKSTALTLTEAAYHDEYTFRRSDGSNCTISSTLVGTSPGQLHLTVVPIYSANPREAGPEGPDDPKVDLMVSANPNGPTDQMRHDSCAVASRTDAGTSGWNPIYTRFHPYDQSFFTATRAEQEEDLLATRSWNNSHSAPNHLGSVDVTEFTTLEVWHRPRT